MDEPPPLEGDLHEPSSLPHHSMGEDTGDVVIVLDLPEDYDIGYDTISFQAKQFKGLRNVPSGAHYLWVAHSGGMSTRCGAWVVGAGQRRVHVLQWDKDNELLGPASSSEARKQADNIGSIYPKLLPCQDPPAASLRPPGKGPASLASQGNIWDQLAGFVSERVLNRITGQERGDWFTNTVDHVKGAALIPAEVELDRRISSNPHLHGRDLNFAFSQLSKTYSTEHTGASRTLEATDATTYILSLLSDSNGLTEDDIVGEFQFAYIVGTHLGNDACIQQWWHMLLKIILRAYTLATSRPSLAGPLLRTLAAQLSHSLHHLESSVLDHSEAQTRDLRIALTVYKRRLEEGTSGSGAAAAAPMSASLAFAQVEAVVAESPLGWDLREDTYVRRGMVMTEEGEQVEVELKELEDEDERGEWAPEVVELDESGREKGLVSWTD